MAENHGRFAVERLSDEFRAEQFSPVAFMKSIVVGDAKEKLSDLDKGDVVRFFEQVAREMKVRYGQDYSIPGITPLYQLVKYNWPEVRTLEREEGQIVFIGELSEWLDARLKERSN